MRQLRCRVRDSRRSPSGQRRAAAGIPLAVLGGPLLETDCAFFDLVEHAGGRVVLDATEGGERTLPRPFDPARLAADPLEELADAYFDGIPDAFRRPNSRLYEWLGRELAARQVARNHLPPLRLVRPLARRVAAAETMEPRAGAGNRRRPRRRPASPNRVQGRIEAFWRCSSERPAPADHAWPSGTSATPSCVPPDCASRTTAGRSAGTSTTAICGC